MLTAKTRLKLQDILTRLSKNEVVSLEERILVQKYADRNSTVWHWLRKARSIQAKGNLEQSSMGGFMQQMNLPGQTSEDHFNGSQDDIGEWFQGSPQWVRRSWFSGRAKGLCFVQTVAWKVVSTVREKWRCVPGIAKEQCGNLIRFVKLTLVITCSGNRPSLN